MAEGRSDSPGKATVTLWNGVLPYYYCSWGMTGWLEGALGLYQAKNIEVEQCASRVFRAAGKLLPTAKRQGRFLMVVDSFDPEIWDPAGNAGAGAFSASSPLVAGRQYHTMTRLESGPHAGKAAAGSEALGQLPRDFRGLFEARLLLEQIERGIGGGACHGVTRKCRLRRGAVRGKSVENILAHDGRS